MKGKLQKTWSREKALRREKPSPIACTSFCRETYRVFSLTQSTEGGRKVVPHRVWIPSMTYFLQRETCIVYSLNEKFYFGGNVTYFVIFFPLSLSSLFPSPSLPFSFINLIFNIILTCILNEVQKKEWGGGMKNTW